MTEEIFNGIDEANFRKNCRSKGNVQEIFKEVIEGILEAISKKALKFIEEFPSGRRTSTKLHKQFPKGLPNKYLKKLPMKIKEQLPKVFLKEIAGKIPE